MPPSPPACSTSANWQSAISKPTCLSAASRCVRRRMSHMADLPPIRWNDQGLIPAIVQDSETGQVLMLAWMNTESLALSQQTGQTHFWSRSRREIWHKGATSGRVQDITAMRLDCDGDALLIQVRPQGPACHTGEVSCFFQPLPVSRPEA